MAAINDADVPVHPVDPAIRGLRHVQVLAPGSDAAHSRHAMVISPGWFDRSPCGTGTSARLAQLHARGELAVGQDFVNESFIGTHFVGRVAETTEVAGLPAIVPLITGRAWLTALSQVLLADDDPFPAGFLL
jgi:proline racemase